MKWTCYLRKHGLQSSRLVDIFAWGCKSEGIQLYGITPYFTVQPGLQQPGITLRGCTFFIWFSLLHLHVWQESPPLKSLQPFRPLSPFLSRATLGVPLNSWCQRATSARDSGRHAWSTTRSSDSLSHDTAAGHDGDSWVGDQHSVTGTVVYSCFRLEPL